MATAHGVRNAADDEAQRHRVAGERKRMPCSDSSGDVVARFVVGGTVFFDPHGVLGFLVGGEQRVEPESEHLVCDPFAWINVGGHWRAFPYAPPGVYVLSIRRI